VGEVSAAPQNVKYDESDLELDDAAFLDVLADSFAGVTIKPQGHTASQIANAQKGTQQFRNRSVRLRAIARRIREGA